MDFYESGHWFFGHWAGLERRLGKGIGIVLNCNTEGK